MQPVQDLSVEDRVEPYSSFNTSVEDADGPGSSTPGRPAGGETAKRCPNCAMLQAINRITDSKHNIVNRPLTPRPVSASRRRVIDDTLYDAFGRPWLDHLHAIESVPRRSRTRAEISGSILINLSKTYTFNWSSGAQVPLTAFTLLFAYLLPRLAQ